MKLSREQVKKVAKLANLPITEVEEDQYSEQLSKILDYIDQLGKVEVSKTKPTYNVTALSNVMREDVASSPSLSQEEALKNASKVKEGYFVTKGVFDNE